MNATKISRDLHDLMGIATDWTMLDGVHYVLTSGTGESGYGRHGGTSVFAYEAVDVEVFVAAWKDRDATPDYSSDFCHAVSPVHDRSLAIALAANRSGRLTKGGSCMPVLSDEEYTLVRETVGLLEGA